MLKYIISYHKGKIVIRPCRTEPPSKLNSGLWCLGFFIELINVTVMGQSCTIIQKDNSLIISIVNELNTTMQL